MKKKKKEKDNKEIKQSIKQLNKVKTGTFSIQVQIEREREIERKKKNLVQIGILSYLVSFLYILSSYTINI